ncbi:MAG TPA: DUF5681 domain-containing protein [Armatimonadota bacterium]|nr:DUF5681 domain-containing protein [Armatimonadota bacterium]
MFKKGQSGNPAGKPPGLGRLTELRRLIASHSLDLIEAVVKSAKDGDTAAQKMLLERLVPAFRPIDAPIAVPRSDDPADQSARIIDLLLSGGLPPDVCARIMQSLQAQAELTLLQDLERRIAVLEGAPNGPVSGVIGMNPGKDAGDPE